MKLRCWVLLFAATCTFLCLGCDSVTPVAADSAGAVSEPVVVDCHVQLLLDICRGGRAGSIHTARAIYDVSQAGPPTAVTEAAFVWLWQKYATQKAVDWDGENLASFHVVNGANIHGVIRDAVAAMESRWDYRFDRSWMQDEGETPGTTPKSGDTIPEE